MPAYDASAFDPPAPVARVAVRVIDGARQVNEVDLLIDTGADLTLLPRSVVESLGVIIDPAEAMELIAFDGSRSRADTVLLEVLFLNKAFRGRYLLIDSDRGILGRDMLASVRLLLDGPSQAWSAV